MTHFVTILLMVSVDNGFNFNVVVFINIFLLVGVFCTLFLRNSSSPWGHKDLFYYHLEVFWLNAFYIQFFNPSDIRESSNFIFFPHMEN